MTPRDFYNTLNKPQRKMLSRFSCTLCEQPLGQMLKEGCTPYFGPKCDEATRINRAKNCLAASKVDHIRFGYGLEGPETVGAVMAKLKAIGEDAK